jgi:oligopeptide transport system permease protein
MNAMSAVEPFELVEGVGAQEQTSLWTDAWRRLRRNRLALLAAIYLVGLAVAAGVAFIWTPYSYSHQGVGPTYGGISSSSILGLDNEGRDILSRLMKGAQVSLAVGIGSQAIVLSVGIVVGLVSGFFRGWFDAVISFLINVFYGIPDILVALILVEVVAGGRPQLIFIIVAIASTRWMDMARLVRGQTLSLREREFVEAARASGARPMKMLFGHILPNALGPVIVQATIGIPAAILFEATLSFLGLGVQPPTPSWGSMASDGVRSLRLAPHIVLAPAIALSITLMAFNFLGDGLRDALDPRQKR